MQFWPCPPAKGEESSLQVGWGGGGGGKGGGCGPRAGAHIQHCIMRRALPAGPKARQATAPVRGAGLQEGGARHRNRVTAELPKQCGRIRN